MAAETFFKKKFPVKINALGANIGSGKSYYAQVIKKIETEQGAPAPRILSIDDYFLAVCFLLFGLLLYCVFSFVVLCFLFKSKNWSHKKKVSY